MNILMINSNSLIQEDVTEALSILRHTLHYVDAPPVQASEQDKYLTAFVNQINLCNPKFIFSIGFHPFISFACELLTIPYIAWFTESYNSAYYSPAIRNKMTKIMVADSAFLTRLHELGADNVHFLPLAAGLPRIERTLREGCNTEKYSCDLSLWGNIYDRSELTDTPLSPTSEVRDSTRGYLEGCIACQYQGRMFAPMSSTLPPYVLDDLRAHFPIPDDIGLENDLEYLDHNFFNPLITYSDRELHLARLASQKRFETVHLYSHTGGAVDNICHRPQDEYRRKLPHIARNSIINLAITNRNYQAAIPENAWEIMASKGFLLSNAQADYRLFSDVSPIQFANDFEMMSKSAYYYHHEDERLAISDELYQQIYLKHTYVHRMQELLSLV